MQFGIDAFSVLIFEVFPDTVKFSGFLSAFEKNMLETGKIETF